MTVTRRRFLQTTAIVAAFFGATIPVEAPPTTRGVVYAANSKLIRRIIVPSRDSDLARSDWVGPGESLLIVSASEPTDLPSLERKVAATFGLDALPCGRCAVIDPTGLVVNAVMADPEIDSIAGHRLVTSATAAIGWRYDGARFLTRCVGVDAAGAVTDVFWHPEGDAMPHGVLARPHEAACKGDVLVELRQRTVASSGTRRL